MTRDAAWRWAERVLILLAVLSLWPWVLGWQRPVWRLLTYVMLAAMLALFLVNVVRLWRMGHRKPTDEA